MTVWWSDLLSKFKGRLSYDDVIRITTRMARSGLSIEPLAACMKRLNKSDVHRDWFPTEWREQLDASLRRISAQESRKAQALACRRELLENTDKVAVNDFLMTTKDHDIRDYWLSIKYNKLDGLNDRDRFEVLVRHYTYSLINQLGLEGLHWQQFNKYVDIDEVVNPYRAICGMYAEIIFRTNFANAMLEMERDDLELVSVNYLEKVSVPFLQEIRKAKDDYAAWISEGNTDGFEKYRQRFTALLSLLEAADVRLKAAKIN